MRARFEQVRSHLAGSQFLRKFLQTFSTRVLVMAIGMVTSIIVTRILGPEGRGAFALAMATGAVGVQLGNLGLHTANIFYAAKDPAKTPSLLGNTLLVGLGMGAVMGVGVFGALTWWPDLAPMTPTLLMTVMIWIPFGLVHLLLQNLLLGVHAVSIYNRNERLFSGSIFFLVAVAAVMGRVAVEVVVAFNLLATVLVVVTAVRHLIHHYGGAPRIDLGMLKGQLPYGLKSWLGSLVGFLLLRIDLFMINLLLDTTQAGLYAVAVAMGDLLFMVPSVMITLFFPEVTSKPDRISKWRILRRLLLVFSVMMIGLCLVAGLLAEPVLNLLYGDAFLPSAPAFLILLATVFGRSIIGLLAGFIGSFDIPRSGPLFGVALLLVNYWLNLQLIPLMGIEGAALTSVVCIIFQVAYNAFYVFLLVRFPNYVIRW
ncbi:MAG: oligosaccharide flippase family protein [Magnetococcales bacterium]|nr:oligosaccharide flippase family protein [Magnetococcales bacterium]